MLSPPSVRGVVTPVKSSWPFTIVSVPLMFATPVPAEVQHVLELITTLLGYPGVTPMIAPAVEAHS